MRLFSESKVLPDLEQLCHALALRLFVLSLIVYESELSKLEARTVNASLFPALMDLDSQDIATLGGGSTVTVSSSVSRTSGLPDLYRRAVTVTLPASQAWRVGCQSYVELRLYSRKVLLVVEQLDRKLALSLFTLRTTRYAPPLSKPRARTVKRSLRPSVMESDRLTITTL